MLTQTPSIVSEMLDIQALGSVIKRKIQEGSITYRQLTAMSGIAYETIHNLVIGSNGTTIYTATAIANALGYKIQMIEEVPTQPIPTSPLLVASDELITWLCFYMDYEDLPRDVVTAIQRLKVQINTEKGLI